MKVFMRYSNSDLEFAKGVATTINSGVRNAQKSFQSYARRVEL